MKFEIGQIVQSRQGRDVTKYYMVTGFKNDRVLLADGSKRPLAAPKAKNHRHLSPTLTILGADEAESDKKLKAALAAYAAAHGPQR